MSEHDYSFHQSFSPGLQMEETEIQEITNAHGQHYWKAVAKIGAIFGAEVEGQITGIGSTREAALARLAEERKKLYESLWA